MEINIDKIGKYKNSDAVITEITRAVEKSELGTGKKILKNTDLESSYVLEIKIRK